MKGGLRHDMLPLGACLEIQKALASWGNWAFFVGIFFFMFIYLGTDHLICGGGGVEENVPEQSIYFFPGRKQVFLFYQQ